MGVGKAEGHERGGLRNLEIELHSLQYQFCILDFQIPISTIPSSTMFMTQLLFYSHLFALVPPFGHLLALCIFYLSQH